MKMKCIEFKRLALSDPNTRESNFVEHHQNCPDCLKYVKEVRQTDMDLLNSLDTKIPSDLVARLQLNQEMTIADEEDQADDQAQADAKVSWFSTQPLTKYAMAASFAAVLFVAGFMVSGQLNSANQIDSDYQALLSGVVEHMNQDSFTPVLDTDVANSHVNTLLASYDGNMKLKYLETLQFSRICPMGEYKGLHASIETDDGQVTFAYIKGDSVGDVLDAGYQGYVSRVKPIKGGNLIIVSRTARSLETVDEQLKEAIYWDI